MVNPTVLNFIEKYAKKYSEEELKKKIISAGYTEREFEEAFSVFYMDFFEGKYLACKKNNEKKFNYNSFFRIISYISLVICILSSTGFMLYYLFSFEFFYGLIPFLEKIYSLNINQEIVKINAYQTLLIITIPFLMSLSMILSSVGILHNKKWAGISFLIILFLGIMLGLFVLLIIFS